LRRGSSPISRARTMIILGRTGSIGMGSPRRRPYMARRAGARGRRNPRPPSRARPGICGSSRSVVACVLGVPTDPAPGGDRASLVRAEDGLGRGAPVRPTGRGARRALLFETGGEARVHRRGVRRTCRQRPRAGGRA
jgi:hypothetical protein